jgi:hypothetical protein
MQNRRSLNAQRRPSLYVALHTIESIAHPTYARQDPKYCRLISGQSFATLENSGIQKDAQKGKMNGRTGNRNLDLLNIVVANQMFYQLNYSPVSKQILENRKYRAF